MLLVSPVGIMYVLRPLVEGRVLRLRDDFLSFKLDVMLAAAFALGLMLVHDMGNHAYIHRGTVTTLVQIGIIVFWMIIGGLHMWQEREQYDWGQRLSPTALYHNGVLYALIGYGGTMVCGMGLIFAPWTVKDVVVRVLVVSAVASWALAWFLWDAKNHWTDDSQNKYDLAHVDDGWPCQHHYRYLRDDIKVFWKDLRGLPGRMAARVR